MSEETILRELFGNQLSQEGPILDSDGGLHVVLPESTVVYYNAEHDNVVMQHQLDGKAIATFAFYPEGALDTALMLIAYANAAIKARAQKEQGNADNI